MGPRDRLCLTPGLCPAPAALGGDTCTYLPRLGAVHSFPADEQLNTRRKPQGRRFKQTFLLVDGLQTTEQENPKRVPRGRVGDHSRSAPSDVASAQLWMQAWSPLPTACPPQPPASITLPCPFLPAPKSCDSLPAGALFQLSWVRHLRL